MRPVTEADRAEILRRHAAGQTRNQIATALNRSGATVSQTVAAAGLTFARGPEVEAATIARRTDLAVLRVEAAYNLHVDGMRLQEQVFEPAVVYAFGGKDNVYEEHPVAEPPAADKRALMAAAATAFDRSMRLEPLQDSTGADGARSMLGALAEGIRRLAEEDTTGEA